MRAEIAPAFRAAKRSIFSAAGSYFRTRIGDLPAPTSWVLQTTARHATNRLARRAAAPLTNCEIICPLSFCLFKPSGISAGSQTTGRSGWMGTPGLAWWASLREPQHPGVHLLYLREKERCKKRLMVTLDSRTFQGLARPVRNRWDPLSGAAWRDRGGFCFQLHFFAFCCPTGRDGNDLLCRLKLRDGKRRDL